MRNNCPICGGLLKIKHGIYGEFFGCINYPKCKYTINIARVDNKYKNTKSKNIQVNDFMTINSWLKNKIHVFSASKEPSEIFENAVGSKFDISHHIKYLKKKYNTMYN